MKKFLSFLIIIVCVQSIYSQNLKLGKDRKRANFNESDTLRRSSKKIEKNKATIDLYKVISHENDTVFVDTSLTIQKDYKFNYLRKDEFGLMPFANVGQTYNSLSKTIFSKTQMPSFGARARHFNYLEIDDVFYYEVPTPLTELCFKTAFKQGQLLDAFFTVNTSKQFNFSIAYKGLRSLGNYQHALTSTGNLRFTTNFKTKNNRYQVKAHIVTQDLLNQENGGLKSEDLINFTSGEEDFLDRAVFDPNFENAENILVGKRFYLNQRYDIIPKKDSLAHSLSLRNIISFEDKYFQFDQSTTNAFFGASFNQSNIRDRVTLENFQTRLLVDYGMASIGELNLGVGYNDVNYGYNNITILEGQIITNRLKDQIVSLEGGYSNKFKDLSLDFDFGVNVLGDIDGSFFFTEAGYAINEDLQLNASLGVSSKLPNYNLLLYQSDYVNYNWDNIDDFKNQNTTNFAVDLKSQKLLNASFEYTLIDNFSFFTQLAETGLTKPAQLDQSISMFKLKLAKELKFGKFALDNTIQYQQVNDDSQSLNLPELITRNTVYYSNHFFKNNALYLQTGITLNYFTEYFMDGYDPLLAEFYAQSQEKLGGFPRFDFFVNAKIRQTRIFFKLEHFNASFTGYDYFSAPNNPYRDFNVRFGLVWNFFL